jgi:hypothetical protein
MTASFDPNTFLNQTVDGAMDTKVTPCPVGEYLAIADKVEAKQWSTKDGSNSGMKVAILWDIQDDNVKALLGRDTVKVPQDIMLDLTDEGGLDLGKGRNVGLGRLREALGLNTPGEPFSFAMIQGRMARVAVSHRASGEDLFHEVKKVTSAQ